jgi:iron complex outermembrane receptor protein
VKLLYGEAFRAPNAYELYYAGGPNKANPNLKPETIKTAELIYEQYFGAHYRALASVFRYDIDNLITQQTDPADGLLVFRNVESVTARGMEVELEGQWPSGYEARVSYSNQESKNAATGAVLENSPRHLVKLNVIAPVTTTRLTAGAELQYTSERRTLNGSDVGGFAVVNLNLVHHRLARGLTASAGVYNIFDKRYADPADTEHTQNSIVQDGRSYRFKLAYGF